MKKSILLIPIIAINFSITKAQIINTIAGIGGAPGYSGDSGQASNAQLQYPSQLDIDASGNIYIADYGNNVIRKITTTGIITTIVGNGYGAGGPGGFSGDGGQATAAELNAPACVVLDTIGNIYIADYSNDRVREVNAISGIITTIAGNGTASYSGDGGPATDAELDEPGGLAFDRSGNMYIADARNNRIRMVTASTGLISTFAGNGTLAFSGDGGQATAAEIAYPLSVRTDKMSNVYIADWDDSHIRKVAISTGIITTVAGTGTASYSGDGGQATAADLNEPIDVRLDTAGNIYIADWKNSRIRMVTASTGIISTITGNGTAGYYGDGGPATAAELDYPDGVAFDASGNIYIADAEFSIIRKITVSNGIGQILNTSSISVYPNPCNGEFTVSLTGMNGKENIEVYNVLGGMIYTAQLSAGNLSTTVIDLRNNSSGLYLYRVLGESGKLIGEGKLIIQ